jgi:hypothetical protein
MGTLKQRNANTKAATHKKHDVEEKQNTRKVKHMRG